MLIRDTLHVVCEQILTLRDDIIYLVCRGRETLSFGCMLLPPTWNIIYVYVQHTITVIMSKYDLFMSTYKIILLPCNII